MRKLREQKKAALQRLDVELRGESLWSWDRRGSTPLRSKHRAMSIARSTSCAISDFEEANYPHIRNLRKFALDEAYSQQVLTGRHAGRERTRTLRAESSSLGDRRRCGAALERAGTSRWARESFAGVDAHVRIQALPEYQRLEEEDSAFQPSRARSPHSSSGRGAQPQTGRDHAVSCQGVSGKVRFEGVSCWSYRRTRNTPMCRFLNCYGQRKMRSALSALFPSITNDLIPITSS